MDLSAETLRRHPVIDPDLFLHPAQACLAKFHKSPTAIPTSVNGEDRQLDVNWKAPPEQTATSKQRPDLVDDGAVAIACLLLLEFTDLLITNIVQRGEGPDYYLGQKKYEKRLFLEVSGTDEQNLNSIVSKKIKQLLKNGRKGGYVAATRFVEPRAHLSYHDVVKKTKKT